MNRCLISLGIFLVIVTCYSCLGKRTVSEKKEPAALQSLSIGEVSTGNFSGITEMENLCLTTEEEWKKYWNLIHSQTIPVPKLPEINFEENILVGCFMGSRNNGGFSVQVEEVMQVDERLLIQITHISPGKNCFNTLAITQPYAIVQIARPQQQAVCEFELLEKQQDC